MRRFAHSVVSLFFAGDCLLWKFPREHNAAVRAFVRLKHGIDRLAKEGFGLVPGKMTAMNSAVDPVSVMIASASPIIYRHANIKVRHKCNCLW